MTTLACFRPWLLVAGFLLSVSGRAAAVLPRPGGLSVSVSGTARVSWQPVEGAVLYRVAVFDAADADGKRPLLAAVWVEGTAWDYGQGPVLPGAGRLPSTQPLPLPRGRTLRVMVAAARADGADKSEWTGEDFRLPAQALAPASTPTPTATPAPAEPQLVATPGGEAELELEGGDEFKSSPEPLVIEMEEEKGPGSAATPATAMAKSADPEVEEARLRGRLKTDPENADVWESLGDALLARRMKAEAHEAYTQALALDGSRKHLREWIRKNVPRR